MARAIVRVPPQIETDKVFEVGVLLQHPMETGYRAGPGGQLLPRNIVTRVEARLDGKPVFAADLFPAITANPYIAFSLRAAASGTLVVEFTGDNGFTHRESVALTVA